jgi:hypothetical protein
MMLKALWLVGLSFAYQAARPSALNAEAVLRKQRAHRGRRLEALAVEVSTALGERDGAVRDAELRRLADQHSCGGIRETSRGGIGRRRASVERVGPPHRGTDLTASAGGGGPRA